MINDSADRNNSFRFNGNDESHINMQSVGEVNSFCKSNYSELWSCEYKKFIENFRVRFKTR